MGDLPEDPMECEALADTRMEQAQRMTIGDSGVKARYQKLCDEVTQMQAVVEKHEADVTALQVCCIFSELLCLCHGMHFIVRPTKTHCKLWSSTLRAGGVRS
jgi:hypothetical protein